MPIEITLCPLCGTLPIVISDKRAHSFDNVVQCPNCGLEYKYRDDSFAGAISDWNAAVASNKLNMFRIRKDT